MKKKKRQSETQHSDTQRNTLTEGSMSMLMCLCLIALSGCGGKLGSDGVLRLRLEFRRGAARVVVCSSTRCWLWQLGNLRREIARPLYVPVDQCNRANGKHLRQSSVCNKRDYGVKGGKKVDETDNL